MKHGEAKLSRTLVLSLAVHAAVFGGALAFAHYGGIMPGESLYAVMVSLVGEGTSAGGQRKTAGSSSAPHAAPVPTPVPTRPADGSAAEASRPDGSDYHETMPELFAPSGAGIGGGLAEARGIGVSAVNGAGDTGGGIPQDLMQHLQRAIEKAKTYPRFARERGIEGTVLVRFKVLPSGDIEAVDVVRSSGTQILDEASVNTVYRAAPMPYVKGWVEVPMVYELK